MLAVLLLIQSVLGSEYRDCSSSQPLSAPLPQFRVISPLQDQELRDASTILSFDISLDPVHQKKQRAMIDSSVFCVRLDGELLLLDDGSGVAKHCAGTIAMMQEPVRIQVQSPGLHTISTEFLVLSEPNSGTCAEGGQCAERSCVRGKQATSVQVVRKQPTGAAIATVEIYLADQDELEEGETRDLLNRKPPKNSVMEVTLHEGEEPKVSLLNSESSSLWRRMVHSGSLGHICMQDCS
jgi:hypothetical protein